MTTDSRTVSRRDFLQAAGAVASSLAVGAGWPGPAAAQDVKKVRFAYLQLGWAACEIIHKEDLLGKRGWQAEYTVIGGPPAPLVSTFAAGNVDSIDMSFALAAKMFEDKVPLRVTGVATAVLGAIVVRKDAGIRTVDDLRGRKMAAIVGSSAFLDMRTLALKAHGLDLQRDVQIVTATGQPDMVNALARKDVDAMLSWTPTTEQVVFNGTGDYLVKHIELWRKATGRASGYPVHVCYLVSPTFAEKHPGFAKDLNDAQRDAVDIWYNRKARALEIVTEITKLPPNVVEFAYGQTVQMLHGLTDEQIDSLVLQLKLTKESGFLKSDIWDNPDRVRKEFFWKG
ncbi:MAG TPA: ABC transporter substrate-binding protein [Methylomirabilota bacterium]|nr:ABC transporter substrate-binding protein [Methylomirabilota bacterium]